MYVCTLWKASPSRSWIARKIGNQLRLREEPLGKETNALNFNQRTFIESKTVDTELIIASPGMLFKAADVLNALSNLFNNGINGHDYSRGD